MPPDVARVWFEGLPDYAALGGSIGGTLVLEADGIVRATDLLLFLHGTETSQITVGAGKSRTVVVQKEPFLELVSSFHNALNFQNADHVGPGTYRFPFRFDIPATAEPSLATTERARSRGRFTSQEDGMYVEYELEARLKVPWWIEPFDREVVPVYSPRRVLGALPAFSSGADPDRPTFQVRIDAPMVLPGTVVTGSYAIDNPHLKDLPRLALTLVRHVEHHARGQSAVREVPQFPYEIALGARAPHYEGTFQIAIPNVSEATGPFTGQLYRTYWVLRAVLDVSLGFNVRVDAVFTPA
jgi:Arrestin (or S-antigen), N-terminal domain